MAGTERAVMEYVDILITVDNLEAMTDFCGWPVKIGDVIPVNKQIADAVQHGNP